MEEIIYRWQARNKSGVDIYDDVTMSQFDIDSIWTTNNTYSNLIGMMIHYHHRHNIAINSTTTINNFTATINFTITTTIKFITI